MFYTPPLSNESLFPTEYQCVTGLHKVTQEVLLQMKLKGCVGGAVSVLERKKTAVSSTIEGLVG